MLGGDVNQANKQGEAPLHGAAWRGANEIVQLLVDRGANLTARNKAGLTPLQIANGEEEGRVANINIRPWTVELLVKLMKERGLPIDMKTGDERFAFEKQKPRPGRAPASPQSLSPEERERLREQRGTGGGQTTEPAAPPSQR